MLAAPLARAQAPEPGAPDPAKVRVRIGPLSLNPTFGLTNAGVDTNIFNEPDQLAPKRDFTMTVTPATDLWLRFGSTWLTGNIREDLVYYNKYASERSANSHYTLGWLVPLNRLTVKVGTDYVSTRERPGFEIDARSQRQEFGYSGSVEIRALSKTFFGLQGSHRRVSYDKAAVFLNSNLQFELNRTMTSGGVAVRHQLTPLTSLTFDVGREQDRFEFSPLRDSNSTQISGGVKFDPFALIKGNATFGYRNFEALSPGLPGYQGSTAAVDLSYVALGSSKLGLIIVRDVQYSYDINQPYYVQTGIAGSIAQQIFGPVDVVGRVGVQRLDYRNRVGVVVAALERADHVHTYGGGIGYHLGRDIRIGFNIDHASRASVVTSRDFSGLTYGTSVTYGL
jgi:Putative beta-barrel porin 2